MLALAAPTVSAAPEESDLAGYHERFKQGLDRYEASDIAGALSFWEPLFRDLGPQKGYRVGYNLARAYEVLGDATRAAERYRSFLDELAQRRKDGWPVDDEVAGDEQKATAHLDELGRTRMRIQVVATNPPESVRIDQSEPRLAGFTAYVAPGPHDVVVAPGTPREHVEHVDAHAGQVVVVTPPLLEPKRTTPLAYTTDTRRPFWAGWMWIAGGATLVAGGLTATAYANATVLYNHSLPKPTDQQRRDYSGAETLAYASWVAPITLAVVTVTLITWFALGTRTKHVRIPVSTALRF
jgi:hypothetical protein